MILASYIGSCRDNFKRNSNFHHSRLKILNMYYFFSKTIKKTSFSRRLTSFVKGCLALTRTFEVSIAWPLFLSANSAQISQECFVLYYCPVSHFFIHLWTGFVDDLAKSKVYGRPVGISVLADGSMLISDDSSNTIWRVKYK